MSTYTIEHLDQFARRDSFAADLIYYTPEYGSFLESFLGARCLYLSKVERECSALLPIAVKSGPLGTIANALPFFGSPGSPATKGGSAVGSGDLLCAVEELAIKNSWESITVVENPLEPISEHDLNRLTHLRVVDSRISQVTHLVGSIPSSLEELLQRFHVKTRNAVRKGASTKQVVVETTENLHWEFLIREHQARIQSLGGIAKTPKSFHLLREHLGDRVRLHCGFVGKKITSALVTLKHEETVEYFTPVVAPEFRQDQVLSHLIAEVMLSEFQSGTQVWNWGGTWNSQDGVRRFKNRFGATERVYRYLHWNSGVFESASREALSAHYPYWYVVKY